MADDVEERDVHQADWLPVERHGFRREAEIFLQALAVTAVIIGLVTISLTTWVYLLDHIIR